MPVPYVKQTWADGSGGGTPTSAARLNVIEDGIYLAYRAPTARVYNTASVSLANNTLTAVPFDSERWDTDTIHDTVTNNSRLTAKTAGVYQIVGLAEFAANATGDRRAIIVLNNVTVIGMVLVPVNSGSIQTTITVATQWQLAVNDYVELKLTQTSGGSLSATGPFASAGPEFMMTRVST